jgi:acyl-CoA hydrolase
MEVKGKKPSESFVEMTELVLPQHTNALGTIFGGVVMSWIDVAAATCAIRHANKQVVTASVDALNFLAPIKLGWIVTLRASVNFVAKSSCEVGVKVTAENPIAGHKYVTANAYLTMVAIDADGHAVPMTPLIPETEQEKKRFAEAENRRKQRLARK